MDYFHNRLPPEVVARNLELVAALSALPPLEACTRLTEIGDGINKLDSNEPKVFSLEDFRAIQDAFGLKALSDITKSP